MAVLVIFGAVDYLIAFIIGVQFNQTISKCFEKF